MLGSKRSHIVPISAVVFEKLESRELFSITLATPQMITAHAENAVPAALIASAKTAKAPKVSAVVSMTGTGLTGEYFSDTASNRLLWFATTPP